MNDIAIQAERLSKLYRIGALQRFNTLRDQMMHGVKDLFRRNGRSRSESNTIWALKDVSFEVKRGEVVGIIGRNGAGKSTLLKILSRVTEPTSGQAKIYGRVGSLLEVGTGFHSELTGRENIYMNGALLGMTKREIDGRFDDIVSFAEVERFIDTPVKRYSSGMYMRLAFAVAAHLQTELLLVDEVLAVGDAAFQKKCLGKMGEAAHQGRTVLFVSHNMGAVETLCTSAMWIEQGMIVRRGSADRTVRAYLKSAESGVASPQRPWDRSGSGQAQIAAVRLLDADGNPRDTFSMGETIVVEYTVEFYRPFDVIELSLDISRSDIGMQVVHISNQDSDLALEDVPQGTRRFRVEIPDCLLFPNAYDISLWVGCHEMKLDYVEDLLRFSIVQSAAARRTTPLYPELGVYYVPSVWMEK
ncbi:MAG TPA: ABC transporter ATP-binding protein [Verrucomicrobiae bacterium]|nr:ABC transporter ATP-binding protein [Verrucomicrobiae bacterium]